MVATQRLDHRHGLVGEPNGVFGGENELIVTDPEIELVAPPARNLDLVDRIASECLAVARDDESTIGNGELDRQPPVTAGRVQFQDAPVPQIRLPRWRSRGE